MTARKNSMEPDAAAKPRSGWARYPNLQRGANSSRNKGKGRLMVQVRRAFIGHPLRSTSEIYDWCYARDRSRARSEAMRWSVRRILDATCDRLGRAPTIGRPWIWRLRNSQLPAETAQAVDIAGNKSDAEGDSKP